MPGRAAPASLGLPIQKSAYWGLVVVLACLRLAHARLLWPDEDYHLAAAMQMLGGKVPYRDFWYDKPPLAAVYYLLIGGHAGLWLRLLDAAFIVLVCWLAFRLARACWGEREGLIAGFLLAFFTAFYLPSAVIPFAVDALLMAPHLAAVYFAGLRRAAWAGFFCGIGLLVNVKAAFVLAVCGVWLLTELPLLLAGLLVPLVAAWVWLAVSGAWPGFYEQVWRWSWLYAQGWGAPHPLRAGLLRVAGWLGFHAALLAGMIFARNALKRGPRWGLGWKLAVWIAFSFAAVGLGYRFAPRYFLQLLPALVIVASRGIAAAWERNRKVAAALFGLLLLPPLVRFGPRYAVLAADGIADREPNWSDVALDLDSQRAAAIVRARAQSTDTLFVWGYRPDTYVYARRTPDGLLSDSQALTGVPADRHLSAAAPMDSSAALRNRQLLVKSRPTFVVDGLGLLNPVLAPDAYPEVRQWLAQYQVVGRTKFSVVYELRR